MLIRKLRKKLNREWVLYRMFRQNARYNRIHRSDNDSKRKERINIRPAAVKRYLPEKVRGKFSGNWDLKTHSVANSAFFTALEEHFKKGITWEDTAYYRQLRSQLRQGQSPCAIANEEALQKQLQRWQALYSCIQQGRQQAQTAFDISIAIDRDGRLILNEGLEELIMAIDLAVPEITVRVAARHAKWVQFQNQVFHFKSIYAPLTHPDLSHLPFKYDNQRLDIIIEQLSSLECHTVLDIGTNWGYACHRLEEAGYRCTAVEQGVKHSYFLTKLKMAQERQFDCIYDSIFDFIAAGNATYDVVLALSVFHHFLADEKVVGQLKQMLHALNMKIMVFEAAPANHKRMSRACLKFKDQDAFADFVIDHTCLTQKKFLYTSRGGRNLYLLT